jgi:hypothetical protein
MSTQVLKMNFRTEEGRAVSINLQNPVDDPPVADVTEAMDAIIDYDIFDTPTGAITEKVSATLVKTDVEDIVTFGD